MANPLKRFGWGARIRTSDDGVRVRCLTAWRHPKKDSSKYQTLSMNATDKIVFSQDITVSTPGAPGRAYPAPQKLRDFPGTLQSPYPGR